MKNRVFIFLILISSYASAQKNWMIGVTGSYDYCFSINHLKSGEASFYGPVSSEGAIPGFSSGISAGYRMTPRFTLFTGVSYMQCGYSVGINYRPLVANDPNIPDHASVRAQIACVQIPVRLSYERGSKWKLISSIGMNVNFFNQELDHYTLYFPDHVRTGGVYQQPSDFHAAFISFSGGVGAAYDQGKFTFRVEPMFNMAFTGLFSNPLLGQRYPGSIGLQAGVFYHL